MRITVLGAGAWGTALAQLLSSRSHETALWTRSDSQACSMRATRKNDAYLPGLVLNESLRYESDLERAVVGAELVLLVVPSQAVRETMHLVQPYLAPGSGLVCASKGIEANSLELMSEVVGSVLQETRSGAATKHPVAVVSGPSFAKEVAMKVPTNLVAASTDENFVKFLQREMSTDWLRVYSSTDPVGVEVGGALKNVIAIAAGACDGLGFGQNTRAALITRGIAEMSRLVVAMGGQVATSAGLAGVGDLVLTCTGSLSRNRTLGHKLGRGASLSEALSTSAGVAEGFETSKSVHALAIKFGVDLPISEAVYSVLHGSQPLEAALKGLFSRPLRAE